MFNGLSSKIALILFGTAVLVLIGGGVIAQILISLSFEAELEHESQNIEAQLTETLRIPLWQIDDPLAQSIGDAYLQHPLVASVAIVNSQGQAIFNDTLEEYEILRKSDIFYKDVQVGTAYVAFSKTYYSKRALWQSYLLYGLIFVIIGVVTVAGFLALRPHVRRIKGLLSVTKDIANNKYTTPINQNGTDEIAQLAKNIASMRSDIAGAQIRLEKQVKERTQELSKANELLEQKMDEIYTLQTSIIKDMIENPKTYHDLFESIGEQKNVELDPLIKKFLHRNDLKRNKSDKDT